MGQRDARLPFHKKASEQEGRESVLDSRASGWFMREASMPRGIPKASDKPLNRPNIFYILVLRKIQGGGLW
jgi:hypothetical protein